MLSFANQDAAFKLHIQEQGQIYGKQVLLNLVKQKGHEKPIKEAYDGVVNRSKLPNLRYEYYDFATETKGMKFENVKVLLDRLQGELDGISYCRISDKNPNPVKQQNGVVRTNCMVRDFKYQRRLYTSWQMSRIVWIGPTSYNQPSRSGSLVPNCAQ